MRLYDILRQRLNLSPMAALRWIYGPDDLPAARLPNFMDERRLILHAQAPGVIAKFDPIVITIST